jgi:hypothetical protein
MQLRRQLVPISEITRAEHSSRLEARARAHAIPALQTPGLPEIQPGQLWLIELPAANGEPSPALRRAIDQANVVIYDRSTADIVARSLPLGSYAEPAADADETSDLAAARAVRFAGDGWSVARLFPARPTQRERIARVRRLVNELAATKAPGDIAVTVFGELNDGVCEPTETQLDRLDLVVVTYPRDAQLTIVIKALVSVSPARLHAVAGNGLAG